MEGVGSYSAAWLFFFKLPSQLFYYRLSVLVQVAQGCAIHDVKNGHGNLALGVKRLDKYIMGKRGATKVERFSFQNFSYT